MMTRDVATLHLAHQDAIWLSRFALAARSSPDGGLLSLLLAPQFARVVREAEDLVLQWNTRNPLHLLTVFDMSADASAATTLIRNSTKFLDNHSRKSSRASAFQRDVAGLEKAYHQAKVAMGGPHWRWLKATPFARFVDEMAVFSLDGGLPLGASIAMAYQLGLDLNTVVGSNPSYSVHNVPILDLTTQWGTQLGRFTIEVGRVLASSPAGHQAVCTDDQPRLPYIHSEDLKAETALAARFEPTFSLGLKLLLFQFECDLGICQHLLPSISAGCEGSMLRMRYAVCHHALSSLAEIAEQHQATQTAGLRAAAGLLASAPAARILSETGTRIRHRCMHYPNTDTTFTPDATDPHMFGVVEHLSQGNYTCGDLHRDVRYVVTQTLNLLTAWRSEA